MKRVVIGNWKMNLNLAEAHILAEAVRLFAPDYKGLTIGITPSFVWLVPLKESMRYMPANFFLAAQTVSSYEKGAYTGEVSAHQLKHVVTYCLVGHSEQRRFHHLTAADINAQIKELIAVSITPVVCFGEMSQSKQDHLLPSVTTELANDLHNVKSEEIEKCLFAYEPLWAIGTGNPATPTYVESVGQHIKTWFREEKGVHDVALLYGGSVTDDNVAELGAIKTIDGLLVGGASLHAKEFEQICARFSNHV